METPQNMKAFFTRSKGDSAPPKGKSATPADKSQSIKTFFTRSKGESAPPEGESATPADKSQVCTIM
jgi:hypothetical protein